MPQVEQTQTVKNDQAWGNPRWIGHPAAKLWRTALGSTRVFIDTCPVPKSNTGQDSATSHGVVALASRTLSDRDKIVCQRWRDMKIRSGVRRDIDTRGWLQEQTSCDSR